VQFGSSFDHWFTGSGCCNQNPRESNRSLLDFVDPVFLDAPNHYAVEVVGNTIKFWVNGNLVIDYVDDTVPYENGAVPLTYGGLQFDWDWEGVGWVDNVVVTDMR
jgi:hypothetical protein